MNGEWWNKRVESLTEIIVVTSSDCIFDVEKIYQNVSSFDIKVEISERNQKNIRPEWTFLWISTGFCAPIGIAYLLLFLYRYSIKIFNFWSSNIRPSLLATSWFQRIFSAAYCLLVSNIGLKKWLTFRISAVFSYLYVLNNVLFNKNYIHVA